MIRLFNLLEQVAVDPKMPSTTCFNGIVILKNIIILFNFFINIIINLNNTLDFQSFHLKINCTKSHNFGNLFLLFKSGLVVPRHPYPNMILTFRRSHLNSNFESLKFLKIISLNISKSYLLNLVKLLAPREGDILISCRNWR